MRHFPCTTLATGLFAVLAFGAAPLLTGCGPSSPKKADEHSHNASAKGDEHAHAAKGPHGGELLELGDGDYRAELLHDKDAHKITIHLLDAETKQPVTSDQTQITLQVFDNRQFVDYTLESVPGDAGSPGASQFTAVNEKLCDALVGAHELKGRLKVSIRGKLVTGIMEHHAHDHGDAGHEGEGDAQEHEDGAHEH